MKLITVHVSQKIGGAEIFWATSKDTAKNYFHGFELRFGGWVNAYKDEGASSYRIGKTHVHRIHPGIYQQYY